VDRKPSFPEIVVNKVLGFLTLAINCNP
jgi:hypothetical protein